MARNVASVRRGQVGCGAVAGPLFVVAFTAIGARRPGYDWKSHTVSSLAAGHPGWMQRANFILAGVLYSCAAQGLRRCPRRSVGPAAVPALVAAAGIGLIGSGVFVTDPVGGFPPAAGGQNGSDGATVAGRRPSREGMLHNLCAVPIFAGIPFAGLVSAAGAARSKDLRWAGGSALAGLVMIASFVLFGRALSGAPHLAGKGGIFQRISIACGVGWLTAVSIRALIAIRDTTPLMDRAARYRHHMLRELTMA